MPGRNRRCIILGWDGATWDLLKPWAEEGVLPNVARLLREGAHGILESTIPPLTPTAWTSIYTGMNPGKHGVFGFTLRPREVRSGGNPKHAELVSSLNIAAPRVWQVLGAHGMRSGLINLPLTYPPEPVHGFTLTGMMTPGGLTLHGGSYPEALLAEVEQAIGQPYVVDVAIHGDPDGFLDRLDEVLSIREKTIEYLIAREAWDLFWVVFVVPDRIQHLFWKYLVRGTSFYDSPEGNRLRPRIIDLYHRLDKVLGRLMDAVDERTTLMLISDHGFGTREKAIYLNKWLEQQGFLQLKTTQGTVRHVMRWLNVDALKRLIPLGLLYRVRSRTAGTIDWPRTRAFASTPDVSGIFINVRGREPEGTVEPGEEYDRLCAELIDKLTRLEDPSDGESLIDRVYRNTDLYWGPELKNGPDLVVVTHKERHVVSDSVFEAEAIKSLQGTPRGGHRGAGVLGMYGPQVQSGAVVGPSSVMDVAPTILYSLGLPVLTEMDGQVLMQAFYSRFVARNPVREVTVTDLTMATQAIDHSPDVYSHVEAAAISEHLKALGYLD